MTEIQTKICTKCKVEKPITSFNKAKSGALGVGSYCKSCVSIYNAEYAKLNLEKLINYYQEYRFNNSEKIAKYQANYYKENIIKISEDLKNYREKNSEAISQNSRKYYLLNVEKITTANKKWRANNKDSIIEYRKLNSEKVKEWKKNHNGSDKAKKRRNKYENNRRKTDFEFSLKSRMKSMIGNALRQKGFLKNARTEEILGCSFEQLIVHLENQFTDGMTWENRGTVWHIDHFLPLASAKNEEEILNLNHYTNLRPMLAIDNIKKGAKMPHEHDYK